MSEPTAVSALPKTPGDALVLQSSDVTANDLEVLLEKQGYTLMERCLEQETGTGCCVFVFKGKPDANCEDSTCPDGVEAEVDSDSDSDSDSEPAPIFKGEGERKLGWRIKTIGSPTGDNDPIISVPGTEDQKVSVEVVLSYAVDRDDPDDPNMVRLCLKMKQCQFGVNNSVNKPHQRGHFVYRIEVIARPTGWSTEVDHVIANPSSDDCVSISKQRMDTKGVGLSVGTTKAPLNFQYSRGHGTSTSGIPTHGWSPTRMDTSARSVLWTWGINYWRNGQQFCPDNPGKLLGSLPTFEHIPDLPFDDLQSVNLNKTNTEAEWVVPRSRLEGVEEIQWDISVKFYTALVMKKRWIAAGNRSFGGIWVRVCKELPPLVHRLTMKLDLQES